MSKGKGLRSIKLGSMDLKWGILAVEEFEAEAREYLGEKGLIKDGTLPGAFELLNGWVDDDAKFRIMALEHCTGLDRDEIVSKIDEEGHPKIDINRALLESLAIAESPLLAVSMRKKWDTLDEMRKKMVNADSLEGIQEVTKELEKKAKALSGALGSPTSGLGSGQTKPPASD